MSQNSDKKYIESVINHINKIPITVMVVDYTRCGSDFFHSLLDNHPEILQFTGYYIFHDFWENNQNKKLTDLINEFVNFENHYMKFDSSYNKVERWDNLGKHKNESFTVNIDKFKEIAFEIQSRLDLNSKNFFLTFNAAYFIARGFYIFKTRILFYHLHRIDRLNEFKEDFRNFKLIIMTRDLRDGIDSYFESRLHNRFDPYTFIPPILTYSTIFREVQKYDKFAFNVLQSLHKYPEAVLKNVCLYLNISYLPNILKNSTWHGKLWWGDQWSNKDMNGFNSNFGATPRWTNKLTFIDIYLIELLFEKQIKKFGYKFYVKKIFFPINLFLSFILIFFPMKYEIKILFYNIVNGENLNIKIKKTFAIFHVYFIRVKYYLKLLKDILLNKKILLPTMLDGDFN